MVGQGVLRECLLDPGVERVLSVGRNAIERQHPKLRECLQANLFDLSPIEKQLQGYDAGYFNYRTNSAQAQYKAITSCTTKAMNRTFTARLLRELRWATDWTRRARSSHGASGSVTPARFVSNATTRRPRIWADLQCNWRGREQGAA